MADTVIIRGEGGAEITYDLPLPDPIAERLAAGRVRLIEGEVDPDPAPAATEAVVDDDDAEDDDVEAPAGNASKAAWLEYAEAQGADPDDLDDMSRDDLAEAFG